MKKVYFLSTCDTCKRIMKEIKVDDSFEKQDIKTSPVLPHQLEEMKKLTSSSFDLLNKRARKYSILGLKDKKLTEIEVDQLILTEYTFLKRPVFIINNHIFIGNSKKNIESLKQMLGV